MGGRPVEDRKNRPITIQTIYFMNKRILSVFVCCALYYSAQAQDAKGGISADMMQQIKQSYQGTSTDKAIRNAISNNDIRNQSAERERTGRIRLSCPHGG